MEYDIKFVIDGEVDDLRKNVRLVGDDVEAQQKALAKFTKKINESAKDYPEQFKKTNEYAKTLQATLEKISKQRSPFTVEQQKQVGVGFNALTSEAKSAGRSASAEPERQARAAEKAAKAQEVAIARVARAQERADKAREAAEARHLSGLIRTRYALYDVANEARRVSLITVGIGAAAVKVGADFETAFADVKRTTGLTGTELGNLRDSLLEISQTSPISFQDISSIATLGAQMGIAAQSLDEFSSTVAKFSAVTGVAVDTSATSFGRIGELLNVSAAGYDRLASSVLYAGRNSLATEAQILTLTSQIAASTAQAGFAADEVIGLATALASLGIAPEQARGVILRLFGDFDKVVSQNGQQLKDYANLLGISTEAVANLIKNDAPTFFVEFTKALGQTSNTAADMTGILSALGIVETREINVLQRLAGNHDLLVQSMKDAGIAYSENSDLSDQYAQKTETLNAKLQTLLNNLSAFAAVIGENLGAFLKPIVDLLSTITKVLASSPIVVTIAALGVALSVGVGIFLLYKAAVAQAIASLFALKTTMTELALVGQGVTISLSGLRAAMVSLGIGGNIMAGGIAKANLSLASMKTSAATLGASLIRMAPQMIAISFAMGVAGMAAKKFNDEVKQSTDSIRELAQSGKDLSEVDFFKKPIAGEREFTLNNVTGELTKFQVALKETEQISNIAVNGIMEAFGLGEFSNISVANKKFEELDNTLTEMVSSGQGERAAQLYGEIAVQAGKIGIATDKVAKIMPNYYAAITGNTTALKGLTSAENDAIASGTELSEVIKNSLTESMIGGEAANAKFVEAIVSFSDSLVDSKGSISSWSASGRKALSSFGNLINEIASISGNDMSAALTMTAAAIGQIEAAGGDAGTQVQGLVLRLNAMYGLNLNGSTVTSLAQLQALIASTGSIAATTRLEINNLLSGGGYADIMKQAFDQAKKSIKSAGSAAKKEVRTINNFASELKSLFSDIYERAFSLDEATDNFDSGWDKITSGINDAKDSVSDLKRELEDITADKAILTYQLGIAEKYGDTLRAAKIKKELAKLDKDILDKNKDLTKAQDKTKVSLTGNTEAAVENREAIREQVKSAQELIAAYASTVQANGKLPTSAQVKKRAAEIAADFTKEAQAVGFAANEIKRYSDLIAATGGAAATIKPPNVKVFLSPVKTAITAYLAEKKETKVSVTPGTSDSVLTAFYKTIQDYFNKNKVVLDFKAGTLPGAIPGLAPNTIGPTAGNYSFTPTATPSIRSTLASYEKSLVAARARLVQANKAKSANGVISANQSIATLEKNIKDLRSKYSFATGGFVNGPGTSRSDSISAQLSKGEYVIQASAVNRYGVDFMNSLNQMRVGAPARSTQASASGGNGSSVVYLSPEDRSLLRAASERPIALYTDNQKIAQSANAGNVVLAQRGMN